MTTNETPSLPELQQALLDGDMLEQLFADISRCTQVIEVIAKPASTAFAVPRQLTLAQAADLLAQKKVRGVQIRYLYREEMWWDTLMVTGQGVRLTRIRAGDVAAG
jgi:hypothetical protein